MSKVELTGLSSVGPNFFKKIFTLTLSIMILETTNCKNSYSPLENLYVKKS